MEFFAKVGIKFGMCKICKSAASCAFVAAVADVATTTNFNSVCSHLIHQLRTFEYNYVNDRYMHISSYCTNCKQQGAVSEKSGCESRTAV